MVLERQDFSRGGLGKAYVPSSNPFAGKVSAEGEWLARACRCSHCGHMKSVFDDAVLQTGHSASLGVNTM